MTIVPRDREFSAQDVRTLLATAGMAVTDDEASLLAVQAVQYFTMLDRVIDAPLGPIEPAVIFRVDPWVSVDD
jgi:hypothetical protein